MSAGGDNPSSSNAAADLYPAGSIPENRVSTVSSVCSYGLRPLIMTGFLRQLFIQHFADPNNVDNPQLRAQLLQTGGWKQTGSGILVESVTRWVPNKTEQRPAVIIKRNDWSRNRLTIGQKAGLELPTTFQRYMGFWHGSHTVFAITGEGAEADILGCEVAWVLGRYSPIIGDSLELHRFEVMQLGAPVSVKEVSGHIAVPVTVAYAVEERWILRQHTPRLKRIDIRTSTLLGG